MTIWAEFMRVQSRSQTLIPVIKPVLRRTVDAIDSTLGSGGDATAILAAIPDPAAQRESTMIAALTTHVTTTRTFAGILTDGPPEGAGGWPTLHTRNSTPNAADKQNILDQLGINWDTLKRAQDISAAGGTSTSLLVIRHGAIAGDWGSDTSYSLNSVSKSLVLFVAARLFDLGLASRSTLMHPHLPAAFGKSDARKRTITLGQMMSFTPGIQVIESDSYTISVADAMTRVMSADPGTIWGYSSGAVNITAMALESMAGRTIEAVLDDDIGNPIGVPDVSWVLWHDVPLASGGASMTPRNLARFAYLLLHRGKWGATQLLQGAAVDLLSQRHADLDAVTEPDEWDVGAPPAYYANASEFYAHFLWTNRGQTFFGKGVPADARIMHGANDMLCVVVPSLDLILVRAATGPVFTENLAPAIAEAVCAAVV
jgi:CubicO group peptidase (beta-lactamase class C family)